MNHVMSNSNIARNPENRYSERYIQMRPVIRNPDLVEAFLDFFFSSFGAQLPKEALKYMLSWFK